MYYKLCVYIQCFYNDKTWLYKCLLVFISISKILSLNLGQKLKGNMLKIWLGWVRLLLVKTK